MSEVSNSESANTAADVTPTPSVPEADEWLAKVIVISGASGSGKSRLARALCTQYGWPFINLDDFYRDYDEPGLPRFDSGEIDWDDPGTWNAHDAADALETLCQSGQVNAPLYSISKSKRTGVHSVRLDQARFVVAEGIFAPHVLAELRQRGILAQAWYLDRPRTINAIRRFIRDLAEHRKPVTVLVRRGLRLWRQEPTIKATNLALGAYPLGFKAASTEAQRLSNTGERS